MKYCPNCRQTYGDDTLNFCLSDGSPLVASSYDAEVETVVIPPRTFARNHQNNRHGVSPLFAYLAVALLALIAGGGIVAWMYSNSRIGTNSSFSENNLNSNLSLEKPPPQQSSPTVPQPSNTNRPASVVDRSQETREVESSLDKWAETLRAKDMEGHMALYDQTVERYFGKSNADISFVRADLSRLFGKYSTFALNISNVRVDVQPDGNRATSTFKSAFNFSGAKRHSGSVRSEIRWRKVGGTWKITSQRDL